MTMSCEDLPTPAVMRGTRPRRTGSTLRLRLSKKWPGVLGIHIGNAHVTWLNLREAKRLREQLDIWIPRAEAAEEDA
jgi:hypothetical protein